MSKKSIELSNRLASVLNDNGWFTEDGCYVLFDGQYGSTGKGLLASVLACAAGENIDTVTTNAGPNSGHTAYCVLDGTKIMTQQIPVSSIVMNKLGWDHRCVLNAGAVIEPKILNNEIRMYDDNDLVELSVHQHASVIKPDDQGDLMAHIASTGKGVGPAMAKKMERRVEHVAQGNWEQFDPWIYQGLGNNSPNALGVCFVETAQGWSLGINSGFYPYTTSRECSVSQAIADLGVSPRQLRKSIVSLRTYPIRVANHPNGGSSGPCYPDQKEITFEEIGQEPELTTVTQRVRRIFTWSWTQFTEMLRANEPDALFINFMNYLPENERGYFLGDLRSSYRDTMGRYPDFILGGYGPLNEDVQIEYVNCRGLV